MAQYEAAARAREYGEGPPSRARVVSRGRVQMGANYTPNQTGGRRDNSKKWSNADQYANTSPMVQPGLSPDMPMSKNNRAMAQLAPLNHPAGQLGDDPALI